MAVDRSALEAALKDAESSLATLPKFFVHLLFSRANALDGLGRNSDAADAYASVLRADPSHFDALTALGRLLVNVGKRAGAKMALARAVEVKPNSATAHANLATLLSDEDVAVAKAHFERALSLDPDNRCAHRGLAVLLLRSGQLDEARKHARVGFGTRLEAWRYRGTGAPVSVLLVLSAAGGNAPLEPLLDDRVFLKWTLAPEFFDPTSELPPHDLVLNAVGDADRGAQALEATAAALARTSAPILNHPMRVGATNRATNAERLRRIAGVVTARVRELPRDALLGPDGPALLAEEGYRWPLLVRSPGFHTGEHFVKVDSPADLAGAVRALPGKTVLAIEFIDTREPDGMFRKYRAMFVGGRLYPIHVAVSAHWKVHYFSADMADRADHRAQDEAYLVDMPGVLGPDAMKTLEAIREQLGLDYGGIDFTIDAGGRVVVFEANATMVIVDPPPDERWRYRRAPVERVKQAVHRMLLAAAGRLDAMPA